MGLRRRREPARCGDPTPRPFRPRHQVHAGANGRRVSAAELTACDRAAAQAVAEVAAELGVRPAQVALAWLRHKSAAVVPIISVSSVAQLSDNVGTAQLTLTDDAVRRLEAAAPFQLGFPGDFMAECEPHPFAFGDRVASIDGR
ncbi:aldo/keto reductase [Nocardia sp. CWNU-33]|uniref:aldo/keto reductase n=1 Tax=Nocardia sp. CWNU-33 TaxID=3392117 RepID=UPI00398E3B72